MINPRVIKHGPISAVAQPLVEAERCDLRAEDRAGGTETPGALVAFLKDRFPDALAAVIAEHDRVVDRRLAALDRYRLAAEQRLAAFAGGEAAYAEVSGRLLAGLLAGEGVHLAVNPGVAPSELFHEAAALR